MIKEKLSKKNWFIITLFCFMGGIAWNTENMYFNTFITNEIYADVSQAAILGSMEATTAVARMVALSAVAAVLTTFIMGALSDKLKNRKMFISVGYILWGIVTAMFGFITKDNVANLFNLTDEAKILGTTVWFVIIMDIVMTFMGSTSNDAAFQAWVTDVTVPRQRPIVETVLSVVGTISSLAVTGVGSFAQAGTITYKLFFSVLGLVVTLCGVLGLFLIKDPPRTLQREDNSSYWANLFYGFRPSVIKENARLYLSLASFCFAIIAFQVFYPYLLTYVQYVVLPDNGGVENILKAPVIITAVLVLIITLACIVILLRLSTTKKGVERKFPYCDYQFIPKMPWNYGYADSDFEVTHNKIGDIPFSQDNPPVSIKANMQQIDWGLKFPYRSIARKFPKSGKPISEVQKIELCPYGCARLRMTEMPLID